ncbi:hypothetical protein EVA_18603 [gut metagenome]|uniref:Uncharacterized protein n=1 Tax=gut metagenome TaxID=749906 RepID=J9C0E1_9ZZZZ
MKNEAYLYLGVCFFFWLFVKGWGKMFFRDIGTVFRCLFMLRIERFDS